jgi:hypothetical protein
VSPSKENRAWLRRRIAEAGLSLASEAEALAVLVFRAELEEERKWPEWLKTR